MKDIHTRDMLKLWSEFLENFKPCIVLDKEKNYFYIGIFLWYSDSKLPENKQPVLEKIITQYLPREDKKAIIRTIAQKYRDEGIQIGQEKGKIEGMQLGKEQGKLEIAKAMLQKGYLIEDIMILTGLSRSHI